jgi:predicted regulator of Ras-like GTPase activity (Roadblock/LC7/MglB family)
VIYFENGEISHAQYGGLTGANAIYEVLALNEGQFRLEEGIVSQIKSNSTPWFELIMEGVRLIDEKRSGKQNLPKRLADDLARLPGVSWVMILSEEGSILSFSKSLAGQERISALITFLSVKAQIIGTRLKLGKLSQCYVVCANHQIVVIDKDKYLIAFLLGPNTNYSILSRDVNNILYKHFSGPPVSYVDKKW